VSIATRTPTDPRRVDGSTGPAAAPDWFAAARDRLRADLDAIPAGAPVRLAKRTSNLFRPRQPVGRGLGVGGFDRVLSVDPQRRTADVGGMTTYADLVDATLPHGLMPLVVPQLRTITLGGAVTGLGIESTSFRNGLPHESVLEAEVLTGAGEIVIADPAGEHAELFRALPNSYGTLGYALRLRIELEQVRPYVRLTHLRFADADSCMAALDELSATRRHGGDNVDFLDGVAFGPDELYLTIGAFADTASSTSDYTGRQIYYRSIRERRADVLRVHDYLWRWDTDWFWCSRAFGAQHPVLRPLWPRRWRRSDVYWKLAGLDERFGASRTLDRLRGRPGVEKVIQDVEIPIEHAAGFLRDLDRITGLRPVWLCPVRQRDGSPRWPLYPLEPNRRYVNVGFWGGVRLGPGEVAGSRNRQVEAAVDRFHGAKSLYSTVFYERTDFERRYGGPAYAAAKARYDPDSRLHDLYAKAVQGC